MSKIRYHSLDSLRGIACLQVIIAHCLVAIPSLNSVVYNDPTNQTHDFVFFYLNSPISFLWSDSAAVKVFFVMSGFVLSLPYYTEGKNSPYYPAFFFKRIIRLYLPCLVIILISILLKVIFYVPDLLNNFGEWMRMMWKIPIDGKTLFNLLILQSNLDYFDRALWTISPEIKLSLILPIFIFFFKKIKSYWSLISVGIYIIIWHTLNKMGARDVWSDYPVLYYLTFFMVGSIICKYRLIITNWINNIKPLQYWSLIILMLLTYTFKYSFFWLPLKLYSFLNLRNDYISAFSAVMILCFSLSKKFQELLNTKVLLFLGKISFSIYLIHIVVIESFAYLLHNYLNPEVIVIVALLFSFRIAIVFYKLIEVPSINISKHFSDFIIKNKYSKKALYYIFK